MSTWGEIRRLQAALDEVQSSSTSHKLSERNCIEVVTKLIEMGMLNVLYTMDGKEYVVTSYLETEIKREIESRGGRINIVDLQEILNIDLVHIQKAVDNILINDTSLELIQGEVISSQYKDTLCTQVNELLLQNGHVSLTDLSTSFGLPLSFITPCVESSVGVLIKGQLDKSGSGLLYTDLYVSRHEARIRGTFTAVTRPTPVGPILQRGGYNDNLFHTILHDLVNTGQLSGKIHGGKSDKSIYIPTIYTNMQNEWADNFLTSNGYLEYDAIGRLGVSDPLKFVKQRFKSHDLLMLSTCCLATSVVNEVEGCVQEEVRRTEKWVDILPVLPAPCSADDAHVLLTTKYGNDSALMVFNHVIAHVNFIKQCQELFQQQITERAKKAAITSGSFLREMSRETGGAESDAPKKGGKQKKGKSGRRVKDKEDEGGQNWGVEFMSKKEISNVLLDKMEDLFEDFAISLADILYRPLQQIFQDEAKRLLAEQTEGEAGLHRKRHGVLTHEVQELWNRARLFEKGALKFEGDLQTQLLKYLTKTLCTDMLNSVVSYVAIDTGHKVPEDTPTLNKERSKIIKSLPDPVRQLAGDCNTRLTGKDLGEFFTSFETLCMSDSCGLMLKKLDKKKEKQLLSSHLQLLTDSLGAESDPPMVLHLTVVILYQRIYGYPIHTPGRLLPQILSHLREGMDPSDYQLLSQLHDIVISQTKAAQATPIMTTPTSTSSDEKSPMADIDADKQTAPTKLTPTHRAETTPSPEGDWEVVKRIEESAIGSETTMESLKLLEEVLEEKRDGIVTKGEESGCHGNSNGGNAFTGDVPSGEVETVGVSDNEKVSVDDHTQLMSDVKNLVLKKFRKF